MRFIIPLLVRKNQQGFEMKINDINITTERELLEIEKCRKESETIIIDSDEKLLEYFGHTDESENKNVSLYALNRFINFGE